MPGRHRCAFESIARRVLSGLAALALVAGSGLGPRAAVAQSAPPAVQAPAAQVTTLALPAGLPRRFALGVAAQPDASGLYGWLPATGVPFDYVYQYLAGGVNSGSGWATWNSQGQFPLLYARGAAERGYVPVFPYYMLLQSRGPCSGCDEARTDLANLNDSALMRAYYQDFALLMQRLGPGTYDGIAGFGKPAIVQVEPDLSGYAQQAVLENGRCFGFCSGRGTDPSLLRAAVAATGVPEVAAYPDTYQGFNWALLRLRDLYAPSVVLAFHVSNWTTGQDVGSSSDPNLDAASLGQRAGTFAALSGMTSAPAGTSTYDLLFNDVGDRDAGYYAYVLKRPTAFWDRDNRAFPNFQRWEQYLGAAVRAAGGKPAFVWQIPLGNQVFRTLDNTPGHYQDNRAEYFFEHLDELRAVGIVGLLFGRGNAGSTTSGDDQRDGVTNPPPRCTTDGSSAGAACNERVTTVPDDDGGYLRLMAGQYYQSSAAAVGNELSAVRRPTAPEMPPASPGAAVAPLAIQMAEAGADVASAAPGARVTLRQRLLPSADAAVLVDFELYGASGKVWQTWQEDVVVQAGRPLDATAVLVVPDDLPAGTYTIKSGVFAPGWGTLYAWNDALAPLVVVRR